MGRPKLPEPMETVSVRLPKSVVDQIDAYLRAMRSEAPFIMLNRADAMRQLLSMALALEANNNAK